MREHASKAQAIHIAMRQIAAGLPVNGGRGEGDGVYLDDHGYR